MSTEFQDRLQQNASLVATELEQLLDEKLLVGEISRPPRLMAAIRHGVLNGGKRLRPFLLIEVAKLFDADGHGVLRAACALECLHCYSLVHDDLPCMDDDDLRRGQPTVHKAYDDAMAVLAGDALLTFAFDMMADASISNDAEIRADLVQLLARAAGQGGMIGGQVLDIAAETDVLSKAEIAQLQAMKTGALIRFACEAGAVLGGATQEQRQSLIRFGEIIGQAFQLADDLLDVTSDSETMGKATGKDAARGKKTMVDFLGIDGSRKHLQELQQEATDVLSPFGEKADMLRATARFIIERIN
jgi:farnesyl diphosphate synthase